MPMNAKRNRRYLLIGVILLLGLVWSLALAAGGQPSAAYPGGRFLVTADWLNQHIADKDLVVVDVREDKYYDGNLIPGAVRLPWSEFRYDDAEANIGERFVGVEKAQKILGKYGITRSDAVVIYDSVERDGGATASYLFWVLDVLGHDKMMILDGGIDAWKKQGFDTAAEAPARAPILYQAPAAELRKWALVDGDYIYARLTDPMYQIIDVRSREEYLGEKRSLDLRGNPLKAGHIPMAVNVDYRSNWVDETTKKLKPYEKLQSIYRGLDADRAVIVYCDSGRRASYGYFVLRVMGIEPVMSYEASWKEWGSFDRFYPVESAERRFAGDMPPGASSSSGGGTRMTSGRESTGPVSNSPGTQTPKGGYVSCGG